MPTTIDFAPIKQNAIELLSRSCRKLVLQQLNTTKALHTITREKKGFNPHDIIPAEFFEPDIKDITNRVIFTVTAAINADIATLRQNLEHAKTQRLVHNGARTALRNRVIPPIDLPELIALPATRPHTFRFEMPVEKLQLGMVTLPEGVIAIQLRVEVRHGAGASPSIVVDGTSEYQIARHLRDAYPIHTIPLYKADHGNTGIYIHPFEVGRSKTSELIQKLKRITVENLRVLSPQDIRDFAGQGEQPKQSTKRQIICEVRIPADLDGGRVVLLAPQRGECAIDEETGRAYSPLQVPNKWGRIPNGHRNPRDISKDTAFVAIIYAAFKGTPGAQHTFDTYVKQEGETSVKWLTRNTAVPIAVRGELIEWVSKQYSQVADVSDNVAEQAPTIG